VQATTLNPAFDPVSPTVTAFDVLDRPTRVTMPDNTTTTVSYGFGPDGPGSPLRAGDHGRQRQGQTHLP
jgi:hypothetical protein